MNPRKGSKFFDDVPKSLILTPNSSLRSTITGDTDRSDSSYFPGCRKDANCSCEICIASINATLDLMPQSIQRCSLTKLSSSRFASQGTPVSYPSAAKVLSPESSPQSKPKKYESPLMGSSGSFRFDDKEKITKKGLSYWRFFRRLVFGLTLVLVMEYGVPIMVSRALRGKLSPDIVNALGETARRFDGLNQKFKLLKNALEERTRDKVSNCGKDESAWKIAQDDLLLNSRCLLYQSFAEEVSIWGWPLQMHGLIAAQYSSRSLTVLTGSIKEWSHRDADYLVRMANSTWTIQRWSSSVVHMDPNTWILEYRKSFLVENPKLVSALSEVLKFRIARNFEKDETRILASNFSWKPHFLY